MDDKPRKLAILVAALAIAWHLLAVLAPAWTTVSEKPSRGRDFATYYYALRVASEGGDPYARGSLTRRAKQDGVKSGVHPFLYPPPFLLLMTWALPFDLLGAYRAWFWLDELWLAVAAFALWRWWRPLGTGSGALVAASIAVFTAVPANHVMGQANFPGLALALLGLWAVDRGRWLPGGVFMGAACMVKMSPALFLGWWLMRGKWKPVAVACLSAVLLSMAVLPLLDPGRQLVFYTTVLPTFGSGEYNGLGVPISMFGNHSMPNLWHQILGGSAHRLSFWAQTVSTLSTLALVGALGWRFRGGQGDELAMACQVGAIGICMLMVPVYTYEHHGVWAIPAVVAALMALFQGRLGPGWAVPLGAAVAIWGFDILELKSVFQFVSTVPVVGFAVQEFKFVALLILLAATMVAGGRRYNAAPPAFRGVDEPA